MKTGVKLLLMLIGLAAIPAQAEDAFRDCTRCPEMVPIQPGSFIMGRTVVDREEEGPPQRVTLANAFAIARTEVTFDQFALCVEEGGCGELPFDRRWGMGDRPVIYVTWRDAQAYADWLTQKTGKSYRLPTEREWEYAARGGKPAPRNVQGIVNCYECWDGWAHQTEPVAQFPANGFGLFDMLGNVMEWTADCWTPTHGTPSVAEADGSCPLRTRKGGSWYFKPSVATPTYRFGAKVEHKGYDIGFRVVVDLE